MASATTFRVGKVTGYLRGSVWYLRYVENAKRRQVRGGSDKSAVRQLAAQVNAQLAAGAPAVTSFESISVEELRRRWLEHHEHVLRSSVATIDRYRTATDHLLTFIRDVQPARHARHFDAGHAEAFVRYLRKLKIAPNGHKNTARRNLRDKGLKFVLAVCRTLFNFGAKRRHLPPYAENPFSVIEIDRIPIEDSKPITLLTAEQERAFLEACDDWHFPIFLTLTLTGMRPGELTHLLLPEDLDLADGWLYVRNKPELGWQVKTRNERKIPLVPEHVQILEQLVGDRRAGPVFLRRRFMHGTFPVLAAMSRVVMKEEVFRRVARLDRGGGDTSRQMQSALCRKLWVEAGAIREERIRSQFMLLTRRIGLPNATAPKVLRHMFATSLQDANVDPLIRNQLMGHTPADRGRSYSGPLSMTGTYTHTQDHTLRRQFAEAIGPRAALDVARARLAPTAKRADAA
jgi:site-specific recombinase XerD